MFDAERLISGRAKAVDASGIRRVFDLATKMKDPINFSIGQPDFDVPGPIKDAAIDAIQKGMNRYTVTQGVAPLREKIAGMIATEFPGWAGGAGGGSGPKAGLDSGLEVLITSGVSGGLMLAILACVGPGDEVLIPDPYFVMYKHLVTLAGGKAVAIDTYPDFQLTPERVERHVTAKTRMLLFNSPGNPTGVVASDGVCKGLVQLAEERGFLLLSDEIYDEFCYEKVRRASGQMKCPSPAAYSRNLLLLRGFSKTYGMTGWRLGWAAGPRPIIEQMTKLQQYSFVCAPSMVQAGGVAALDVDMSGHVEAYRKKRDRVVERLSGVYPLTAPGGAFYAFPRVPERLGVTAAQFVERAIEKNLLIIPGSVFSGRDTHFRISYACDDKMLDRGLDVLVGMAG